MKRFAVLFFALVLTLSCQAAAAAQPVFTPTATLSEDGTTITVTVALTEGSQVCGATFDFSFDPTLFACQSVTAGSALSGSTFIGNTAYDAGVARGAWMGLTPLKSDGTVAVITLKVLTAAEGKTASFSISDASAYNELGSSISVKAGQASLEIPNASGSGNGNDTTPSNPSDSPADTPSTPPSSQPGDDYEVFLMTFTDVPETAYYYSAVRWAVENGITTGTSDITFSPDVSCNRAQTVTFLWRAAGCPTPSLTSCPFSDVPAGAYYYDAVLWAVEQGITTGTSATTFSPNAQVTRSQVVTFLWRAAGSDSPGSAANPFSDVSAGAYYCDAVRWAVENNITTGTSATTFGPVSSCTRAQIVTFLYRSVVK